MEILIKQYEVCGIVYHYAILDGGKDKTCFTYVIPEDFEGDSIEGLFTA